MGRKTNISSTSDHDVICILPNSEKNKFNNHVTPQTDLIQNVKEQLIKRFPNTELHGDGQIISIDMNKGKIELVPAFLRTDNKYYFPDTHNGGSWKITDPVAEIKCALDLDKLSSGNFVKIAKLARLWRDHNGIPLKGIVIDSVLNEVYNHDSLIYFNDSYLEQMLIFFKELIKISDKEYITSLGSNTKIKIECNNLRKFADIGKNIIENENDSIMEKLFGLKYEYNSSERSNNEEFIDEYFKMNLKYSIKLDAIISQNGFRDYSLRSLIRCKKLLPINKSIKFYIKESNIPNKIKKNIKYFWKVRNRGSEAKKRNNERGRIYEGKNYKIENSQFFGKHYVECFLVINSTVIAKSRINVPID